MYPIGSEMITSTASGSEISSIFPGKTMILSERLLPQGFQDPPWLFYNGNANEVLNIMYTLPELIYFCMHFLKKMPIGKSLIFETCRKL